MLGFPGVENPRNQAKHIGLHIQSAGATTQKPSSAEQSKPGAASAPVHRATHGARRGEVDMEHLMEP